MPVKIINSVGDLAGKSFMSLCEIGIKKAIGSETVDIIKDKFSSESLYDDFKMYQDSLKELKQTLIKWAKKNKQPIVIIIDELDRCRPDYAVKTLEVLKHFFDVSGFVFVLALDEKQLESSVNCLFGTNNFEGYKRKFINNTFLLPAPDRKAFTEFLYDKFGMAILIEKIQNDNRDLVFKIRTDSDCDMIA